MKNNFCSFLDLPSYLFVFQKASDLLFNLSKVTVFVIVISIGTLNLLTCYFWIVNSDLFGKIIHTDYFLSMDSTRTNVCDLVLFFLHVRDSLIRLEIIISIMIFTETCIRVVQNRSSVFIEIQIHIIVRITFRVQIEFHIV